MLSHAFEAVGNLLHNFLSYTFVDSLARLGSLQVPQVAAITKLNKKKHVFARIYSFLNVSNISGYIFTMLHKLQDLNFPAKFLESSINL